MAKWREAAGGRILMGRLEYGKDLLEELTAVCEKERIILGRMEALGALQKARLGYYDQQSREYCFSDPNRHLEILNLTGNISLKDGKSMVHAHVTLADEQSRAFGGHLCSGCIIFACEFVIQAFEGPAFERHLDDQTALSLWDLK